MHTINKLLPLCAALLVATPAYAANMHHDMASEHGGGIFHMFRLETDYGGSDTGDVASWDLDGWIGTDNNKLWLKSEGSRSDGKLEDSEFWAMYSRNIAAFWDVQAGLRYDTQPETTGYAILGVNGLAPYWFETEAHLFISDEGDVTARLREENDFLFTQKLIAQPYAEINLAAQDIPDHDTGAGITDGQVGVQLRYETTKSFAPYIDIKYERLFGETSSIASQNGEDNDSVTGSFGLRLMF